MQRYFAISKEKEYLFLKQEDIHHIKNVMRNKVGNEIECIYQEKLYICKIESLDSNKVKIVSTINEQISFVTLFPALSSPSTLNCWGSSEDGISVLSKLYSVTPATWSIAYDAGVNEVEPI